MVTENTTKQQQMYYTERKCCLRNCTHYWHTEAFKGYVGIFLSNLTDKSLHIRCLFNPLSTKFTLGFPGQCFLAELWRTDTSLSSRVSFMTWRRVGSWWMDEDMHFIWLVAFYIDCIINKKHENAKIGCENFASKVFYMHQCKFKGVVWHFGKCANQFCLLSVRW